MSSAQYGINSRRQKRNPSRRPSPSDNHGVPPIVLAAPVAGMGGDIEPTLVIVMVAMTVLCGIRTMFPRLVVHPVGSDITGGIEEGGESSGHCSQGVVDLVLSTCVIGLLSQEGSIQGFNGDDFGFRALVPRGGVQARRLPVSHQTKLSHLR